ncbi:MAG: methionine synthase [Fretibacterium sp.]|nr:methionine synthase [Fretibacterium sp.]
MTPSPRMTGDALRFMRVPPEGRTPELTAAVEAAFEKLEGHIRPRWTWGRFPVSSAGEEINIAGAEFRSADLAKLMARSKECYLMAVTLGPEADRQILLAQKRGMMEGLMLDACASVRADALCDQAEAEIAADLRPGEHLTMRFSPGYGDAPLRASEDIIALLNATRRIGLSMTRSSMMTPVKSVTALLGVTDEEECRTRGCDLCSNRENCPYRSAGGPCK